MSHFSLAALLCVMEVEQERVKLEKEAEDLALKASEGAWLNSMSITFLRV